MKETKGFLFNYLDKTYRTYWEIKIEIYLR